MATQRLAEVFIPHGKNIRINTTPGRTLQFHGGHATVVDHRDMPFVLRMPEAKVVITEFAMGWAEQWCQHTPKIEASLEFPEGYAIAHVDHETWRVWRPEDGELPTEADDPRLTGENSDEGPAVPGHRVDCPCGRCIHARRLAEASSAEPAPPVSAEGQVNGWFAPASADEPDGDATGT